MKPTIQFLALMLFFLSFPYLGAQEEKSCAPEDLQAFDDIEQVAKDILIASLSEMSSPEEKTNAIWAYFMNHKDDVDTFTLKQNLRMMFFFSEDHAPETLKPLIRKVLESEDPNPDENKLAYQRHLMLRTIAIERGEEFSEFYPLFKTRLMNYKPRVFKSGALEPNEVKEFRALLIAVSRNPESSWIAKQVLDGEYMGPDSFYAARKSQISDLKEREKPFLQKAQEYFNQAKADPAHAVQLNSQGFAEKHQAEMLRIQYQNLERDNARIENHTKLFLKPDFFLSGIVRSLAFDPQQKEKVVPYLNHSNPSFRVGAITGLASHPQNWPELRKYLSDKNPDIQRASIGALKNDPQAWPQILPYLNSDHFDLKEAVTTSFYQTHLTTEIDPYLPTLLKSSYSLDSNASNDPNVSFEQRRQRAFVRKRLAQINKDFPNLSTEQIQSIRTTAEQLQTIIQGQLSSEDTFATLIHRELEKILK